MTIPLLFNLAGYGQIFVGVCKSGSGSLSESHQHLIMLIGLIVLAISTSIVLVQSSFLSVLIKVGGWLTLQISWRNLRQIKEFFLSIFMVRLVRLHFRFYF
jgi:hypothetical protein